MTIKELTSAIQSPDDLRAYLEAHRDAGTPVVGWTEPSDTASQSELCVVATYIQQRLQDARWGCGVTSANAFTPDFQMITLPPWVGEYILALDQVHHVGRGHTPPTATDALRILDEVLAKLAAR